MSGEGEEDPDAEHRKRLLATQDDWPQKRPFQPVPIARHEARHEERDNNEMQEAIWGEICLVVGNERVEQPGGKGPTGSGSSRSNQIHQAARKTPTRGSGKP